MGKAAKQITSLIVLGWFAFLAWGSSDSRSPQERAQDECESDISAYVMSQTFIERRLRAPSTADFPFMASEGVSVRYLGDCTHEVRAYVDAENAFGGTVRNNYYVKLQNELGTDTWRVLEVRMSPR